MIPELLRQLRSAGLAVTIEEMIDIVWLAGHLPAAPAAEPATPVALDAQADARAADSGARQSGEPDAGRHGEEAGFDYGAESGQVDPEPTALHSARTRGSIRASTLRVPGIPDNVAPAALRRALRPLARRTDSRTLRVLDEDATAGQAAQTRVWYPILRPVRERWFDLILVTEDTASVKLWETSLQQLTGMLRKQGGFRSVQSYRLSDEKGQRVTATGSGSDLAAAHLARRGERQLVLFMTDATSARWHSGAAQGFLRTVGRSAPVSVLQLLPARAWRHTCIGEPAFSFSARRHGDIDAGLQVALPSWTDSEETLVSLAVPTIGLTVDAIAHWARVMAGHAGASVPGFLLAPADTPGKYGQAQPKEFLDEGDGSAAARVGRYRSMVSHGAYELAVFLAAVDPLTIPVMRLVQRTMLPTTGTAELAEFFLGGLIGAADKSVAGAEMEGEAVYRMDAAVRGKLTTSLRYTEEADIHRMLRRVGQYLEGGASPASAFTAYFPDPGGKFRLAEWSMPFASVSRHILASQITAPRTVPTEGPRAASPSPGPWPPPHVTGARADPGAIMAAVAVSGQLVAGERAVHAMPFYATPGKRTWAVGTTRSIVVVSERTKSRKRAPVVQQVFPHAEIRKLTASVDSDGTPTVGFDDRDESRWYYSPDMFPTPASLQNALSGLLALRPPGLQKQDVPDDLGRLPFDYAIWRADNPLYRVSRRDYRPVQFISDRHSGFWGNPVAQPFDTSASRDTLGPILYCAETIDSALTETLFHMSEQIGTLPELHLALPRLLDNQALTTLQVSKDLIILPLSASNLTRIGERLGEFLVLENGRKRIEIVNRIRRSHPHIDGVSWQPRRGDGLTRLLILFGDRTDASDITVTETRPLMHLVGHLDSILAQLGMT